jgi:protein phosphatase
MLSLRFAARSDVGLVREGNEDSGFAGPQLLAVADGMGGHAAGEVASSVAVSALALLDDDVPGSDLLDRLAEAAQEANGQLREMTDADPVLEGMGTTLTALLFSGGRLGLVHVGDSRAYLLRGGQLERITRDHTFVQGLIDAGRISADEAEHHPQRSLITRALDGRGDIELDTSVREVRAGDRYLVCSDGLSAVVSEETMRENLSRSSPPEVVEALVELALRGGGPDNITCVVADVVETDRQPLTDPLVVGAAGLGDVRPNGSLTGRRSSAERAAALVPAGRSSGSRPRRRKREPTSGAGRGRRRLLVSGLLLLLLLGVVGAGAGGWAWAQTQYFVGAQSDQVTIFRGVGQSVAGVDLASVHQMTGVPMAALPESERTRVEQTISAADADDAERIVERLRLQACARLAASPPAAEPAAGPAPELRCAVGTP